MITLLARLRRVGRAAVVALALYLCLSPVADIAICGGDELAAAASSGHVSDHAGDFAASAEASSAQVSKAKIAHPAGDQGDACVHGHCHPSGSPAALVVASLGPVVVGGARLLPAQIGLPPSRAPDSPIEPPRA